MQKTLDELNIKAQVVDIQTSGPVTRYFLRLLPGGRLGKLERCATELALGIKAHSMPIIKPILKSGLISMEFLMSPPNKVLFSDVVYAAKNFKFEIPLVLGKTHSGNNLIIELADMPHLLVAGTTGSGKSIMLHSIINGIILNSNAKIILIDPKQVEFSAYDNLDSLMFPITSNSDDAIEILEELISEMNFRFGAMKKEKVSSIVEYNKQKKKMDYIVVVIDEFSDLMQMAKKEFQKNVCIIAQKSRACGIHIIMATQRPSVDVVTGLIKANIPGRISCTVSSAVDSRVVLGKSGAENLLGCGDAILNSIGQNMVRFQGAYLDAEYIKSIVNENKKSKTKQILNFAFRKF